MADFLNKSGQAAFPRTVLVFSGTALLSRPRLGGSLRGAITGSACPQREEERFFFPLKQTLVAVLKELNLW